jgi:predicted nucleic acid-binding protein
VAYLLDTNVVCELRKAKPDQHVLAWHQREADVDVFISTLVIGQIARGIERVGGRDAKQAETLRGWLAGLVTTYHDRVLPVTATIAAAWGRLSAGPQPPPVVDGLMAATAQVHRLTLVTRNIADVARTGVRVVNPFEPG